MIKQKLYLGANYATGVYGKKLLVVGHQKHATPAECEKFRNNPELKYTNDNDNCEMLKELCTDECLKWEPTDRKSWLQFGRMLSGDLGFELGSQQSKNLFNSIAFCNYLQVPDFNLEAKQGRDKEELYIYSRPIFKEYLEEAKPDKIIVWGTEVYPYIVEMGKKIDDQHCTIILSSGHIIDVLQINHPCRVARGGYEQSIQNIKDFILK
jgi:hypothetical protein